MKIIETDHPWGNFLNARVKAIKWLKDEFKHNDKEIAETLSMDEMQVFLISESFGLNEPS
jgi:hypothetical protein